MPAKKINNKENKKRKLLLQRWEALKLCFTSEEKFKDFFGIPDTKFRDEEWIVDLMEYATSSKKRREMDYRAFRRELRAFESIEIYSSTPNLSGREKKLKEIFGKYQNGIPYSDLIEEYGDKLVESTCELFNLRKG